MISATTILPQISVVMPARNARRFIGAAVESVIAQTVTNWELLIIDDASDDNTTDVVAEFHDPRIIYRRVTRIGSPAGVRNVGIEKARGELIAFLDADDLYFADTLERLSRALLNNPRLFAAYGFGQIIDEEGKVLHGRSMLITLPQGGFALPQGYSHSWENIVLGNFSGTVQGLMLRRAAISQVGRFNENLCGPEDTEYYVRLFLHDRDGVQCLPEPVYQHRIHMGSLTRSAADMSRVLDSTLQLAKWLFTTAPFPVSVAAYRSEFYCLAYFNLARKQLLAGRSRLARQIVFSGLRDANISSTEWLRGAAPLLLRSWLPLRIDQALVALRAAFRGRQTMCSPETTRREPLDGSSR